MKRIPALAPAPPLARELPGAKLRGSYARHGAECAGGCAVVVEAALVRDFGDGAIRFAEKA